MLPDFLYNIEFKSPKGAEGPTLLLRYVNADENAPDDWRWMNLIVAPDLKWFDWYCSHALVTFLQTYSDLTIVIDGEICRAGLCQSVRKLELFGMLSCLT